MNEPEWVEHKGRLVTRHNKWWVEQIDKNPQLAKRLTVNLMCKHRVLLSHPTCLACYTELHGPL